jgi:hypothetical protein
VFIFSSALRWYIDTDLTMYGSTKERELRGKPSQDENDALAFVIGHAPEGEDEEEEEEEGA